MNLLSVKTIRPQVWINLVVDFSTYRPGLDNPICLLFFKHTRIRSSSFFKFKSRDPVPLLSRYVVSYFRHRINSFLIGSQRVYRTETTVSQRRQITSNFYPTTPRLSWRVEVRDLTFGSVFEKSPNPHRRTR